MRDPDDLFLIPFDVRNLAFGAIDRRHRRDLEPCLIMEAELVRHGVTGVPLVLAILSTLASIVAEREEIDYRPSEIWERGVDWARVDPATDTRDERGRITRLLDLGARFNWLRPDTVLLAEFLSHPDLAAALYWAARDFIEVRDRDRMHAAVEAVDYLGPRLALPGAA